MSYNEDAIRNQATANVQSSMLMLITWYYRERQTLEKLADRLYDGSFAELTGDILGRGLDDLKSIDAMFEEQKKEDEYERSEKDCMWTDGCD